MKKLFIYLFAALAVASCEHKDLCYDHSHTIDVEVVFDWRNASEAAPESMSLYTCSRQTEERHCAMSSPIAGAVRSGCPSETTGRSA